MQGLLKAFFASNTLSLTIEIWIQHCFNKIKGFAPSCHGKHYKHIQPTNMMFTPLWPLFMSASYCVSATGLGNFTPPLYSHSSMAYIYNNRKMAHIYHHKNGYTRYQYLSDVLLYNHNCKLDMY